MSVAAVISLLQVALSLLLSSNGTPFAPQAQIFALRAIQIAEQTVAQMNLSSSSIPAVAPSGPTEDISISMASATPPLGTYAASTSPAGPVTATYNLGCSGTTGCLSISSNVPTRVTVYFLGTKSPLYNKVLSLNDWSQIPGLLGAKAPSPNAGVLQWKDSSLATSHEWRFGLLDPDCYVYWVQVQDANGNEPALTTGGTDPEALQNWGILGPDDFGMPSSAPQFTACGV